MPNPRHDSDIDKGAVEQDKPSQETNTSLTDQLPHRNQIPAVKAHDSDYPEPRENPEHSGEPRSAGLIDRDRGCEPQRREHPEGLTQDQDPGGRQKRNQGGKKDDPLAA